MLVCQLSSLSFRKFLLSFSSSFLTYPLLSLLHTFLPPHSASTLLFTMLLWCGNGQIGNWLIMASRKTWVAVGVNKTHNAHKTKIAKDLRISMCKITAGLILWPLKWLLRDNLGLKSWEGLQKHILTVPMMVRKVKKLHEIAHVPQEPWASC